MRVVVSTPGRFHSFDLAAELENKGSLERIFTGYPAGKLRAERVSPDRMTNLWAMHGPLMASLRLPCQKALAPLQRELFAFAARRFDWLVSERLPPADGLIALSGSGLMSGLAMKRRGGFYVCDRGSTHILFQQEVLQREAGLLGVDFRPAHPDTVAREIAEYSVADMILTPSHFTYRTFLEHGVPEEKLRLVPYGIDTAAFSPGDGKHERFTVLFAGQTTYRKGIHYLLKAWAEWAPPHAELRVAGGISPDVPKLATWAGGMPRGVTFLGHLDKRTLASEMGRAHALVLPSIEEGLAIVMAQAMSCATPVIATENTGAETLFTSGEEGLIGPARSTEFLCSAFERLASDARLTIAMGRSAKQRSTTFGSSQAYGDRVFAAVQDLCAGKAPQRRAPHHELGLTA